MAQREVRVLLNHLTHEQMRVICIRLETDQCEIEGHLVSASRVANVLDKPIAVEAVVTANNMLTRIGDTLILRNPSGEEIGRRNVAGIELSHTDLLSDDDQRGCVAEALAEPANRWSLILSSGPIWCFHFSEASPAEIPPESC